MPDDTQEQNCAAGICCDHDAEGMAKRKRALWTLIKRDLGPHPSTEQVVSWFVETRDSVDKSAGLAKVIDWVAKLARDYPYE